jgi:hypothetical protein
MSETWLPQSAASKFQSRWGLNRKDRLRWKNTESEDVPAYGVVELVSYDNGNEEFSIRKPTGTVAAFPNGPVAVPAGGRSGSFAWDVPRAVLLDSYGYSIGDTVGPVAGQWEMSGEGQGFFVFREPNQDNVAVVAQVGASGSIRHAEVIACLGNGYYQMRLSTSHAWDVPEQTYETGESGYAEDECDLCTFVDDGEGSNCGDITKQPDREQMSGDSAMIVAYDPRAIPLEIPGHAIVIAGGATVPDGVDGYDYVPGGIYGYDYEGATTPLWFVLNGTYPIVGIPHETWKCCVDPETGVEFIKLTKCDVYMVEGVLCPGIEDPCPGEY